jgi:hypothetical protein
MSILPEEPGKKAVEPVKPIVPQQEAQIINTTVDKGIFD